ncbi:MAG: metallophosphoesterase [Oscillospiraceae bacterium]|nr:metallophosphoesterase [Oscillospiraceae bacterium]
MAVLFVPAGFLNALAASGGTLQVGVLSDLHIYHYELTGNYSEAFRAALTGGGKQYMQSEAILQSALAGLEAHAKKNGMKTVLISGDLTKDGELEGHQKLAKTLLDFEARTSLQVAVIPGNHDINNSYAVSYADGVRKDGTKTTPEQFRAIYDQLGFDLPNLTTYTPPEGKKGGMLSYAADLPGNYRLLALDTCKYSNDQSDAGDEHETGGMMSDELIAWAVAQIKAAKSRGQTVIAMGHHNLTPHLGPEERIFQDFMLDDWLTVRETLADAGLHFWFSGHIHVGEIGDSLSDDGESLYDICTSALVSYPSTFREVKFATSGQKTTADIKTYEADCVLPVSVNHTTYPSPYSDSSFELSFSKNGLNDYLDEQLRSLLGGVFDDIQAQGGVSAYLLRQNIDLGGLINDAIGGGVKIGSVDIFTGNNVMGLINYVLGQVDALYVNDFGHTMEILNGIVAKILALQVSDLPSTQFVDSMGIGNKNRPGTLADLVMEVLVFAYSRQDGAAEDKFLADAIKGFDQRDTIDNLIQTLLDVILNDLLQDELLQSLELKLSPVFTTPIIRLTLGTFLDGVLRLILQGDTSFASLVDFIFSLGLLEWDSLPDVVDSLMDDYWTPSQSESIGATLADIIKTFVYDAHDYGDLNVTLTYDGKKTVVPTQEDYRLPTLLVQTFGNDAATTRNIGWFTKSTVKGTDIRIWDAKTGKDVTNAIKIAKTTEACDREFPGADLGIFGLFPVVHHMQRHTIRLENLQQGKKYIFQVGDASKGWWSPKGEIKTADGDKTTTFASFTDQQGQLQRQYQRSWGDMSSKSTPAFILSAGDQVDAGLNLNQWQWFFDTAQSALLKTPLMPTTGNHEDASSALNQFFPLYDFPAQETETGLYYSFDYNNIHFAVLNTNDLENDQLSATQVQWLKDDMAQSDADWNIAMYHKSIYSNGSHVGDSDVTGLRAQLGALLPELGFDLAISGHDHTYLRTAPMQNGKVTESGKDTYSDPQGTIFAMAATSGVKYYNAASADSTDALFPRAEKLVDVQTPVFAVYHVDNGVLSYTAQTMDDDGALRTIDTFSIEKSSVEYVEPIVEDDTPSIFPDTGDTATVVTVVVFPVCLLIAAGFALVIQRKKRT